MIVCKMHFGGYFEKSSVTSSKSQLRQKACQIHFSRKSVHKSTPLGFFVIRVKFNLILRVIFKKKKIFLIIESAAWMGLIHPREM